MNYPFLIILAILPSIIWLLFYLRKDAHPESNKMILKVFVLGGLAALPAVFIELGFFQITEGLPRQLAQLANVFIGVALVEEVLKYLVVRQRVFTSSELDEPLDIMLYLIIAALGFAALENLLIFLSPSAFGLRLGETLALAGFRFISATFLHALASGTLGFFLALGFLETKKRTASFAVGLLLATLLHGIYNWAIITQGPVGLSMATITIAGLALFVSWGFKRVKKMPSVCLPR